MFIDIEDAPNFVVLQIVVLLLDCVAVRLILQRNRTFDHCLGRAARLDLQLDQAPLDMPDILEVTRFGNSPLADNQKSWLRLNARWAAAQRVTSFHYCRLSAL